MPTKKLMIAIRIHGTLIASVYSITFFLRKTKIAISGNTKTNKYLSINGDTNKAICAPINDPINEKKDAEKALKAFTDVVAEELKKDGKVQLVGFGTFEVSKRAAREGRNPQTGKTMKIAACKAPKFKAGKALKDAVNA